MDAKPQRVRVFQGIENDENLPPVLLQPSNAREKSTCASTAMGGLKVPAKRTAFADLSNTAKNPIPVHDGYKKSSFLENVGKESVGGAQEAFLRPAQRLLKQTSTTGQTQLKAQPLVNGNAQHESKVPMTKKTGFVYNDNQQSQHTGLESNSGSHQALTSQHRQVRQYKSQPQLKADMPVLRRTQSKQFGTVPVAEPLLPMSDLTEALYEDAVENLLLDGDYLECENQVALGPSSNSYASGGVALPPASADKAPGLEATEERITTTIMSEPEEYWEEEEEEIYDDAGYTTAHSFRSRGDFTTGGVTTVLYPKVTNKVLRELEAAKAFVEATRTEYDIEEDIWDVSMVAEYGDDIFEYMRELEVRLLPNAHYMDNQTEIQWSMRSVLMDWLVQVHNRFNLLPETLFLAVNFIDRFLSNKVVSLGKLQLVGATAILVASKYEEINCPSLQEIVYMVDGGYSVDEVTKAERYMLTILNFELGWPGPMSFLRRISKADDYDLQTRTLAKYFLEVTVMDERFVGSPCSFLAAGAHCLSRFILHKGEWSAAHVHYSGYTWSQLKPLLSLILDCCQVPHQHHAAVYDKYNDKRYKHCSEYVQDELKKGFTVPSYQPSILPFSMSQRSGCAGDNSVPLQYPRLQLAPEV